MFNLEKKNRIRILLSGYSGRMGKAVQSVVRGSSEFLVTAGVFTGSNGLKTEKDNIVDERFLYNSFREIQRVEADVIIDFSSKDVLEELLNFALNNKIPLVIGTTGYSEDQLKKIKESADVVPIFFSGNMSIGVNVLVRICKEVVKVLKNSCDVEILEKHHNKKKDAPSGTALMIADAISSALSAGNEKIDYIFDRTKNHGEKKQNEIGISCIRAGTIVGEHSVIFGLDDETLTLTHTAVSRKIFAKGALVAAKFILKKSKGLYFMEDLCNEGLCCLR